VLTRAVSHSTRRCRSAQLPPLVFWADWQGKSRLFAIHLRHMTSQSILGASAGAPDHRRSGESMLRVLEWAMNIALRKPMTLEQFLAWEEQQEQRYEFDGFQPIAMTGGTAAHAAIQVNLITALRNRLKGQPCRPFGSELKIEVAGRIRYPDAFVICTPIPPRSKVVTDRVLVFEILSDSTAGDDLVGKNAEYRATSSVRDTSSCSRAGRPPSSFHARARIG
jgi:hypothetical protein